MQTNLSNLLVLKAPAIYKQYTNIVLKQTTNYQNPSVCSSVMSWAEEELDFCLRSLEEHKSYLENQHF